LPRSLQRLSFTLVKTLLIEDDAKTAGALKRGLEAEGFDATIAVSGEEGFFLLSKESFDVVVLD
jgi:DNA-binding response OmpR family regulator